MLKKKIKVDSTNDEKRKKILLYGLPFVLVIIVIIGILFSTGKFSGLMGNSVDTKEKMASYYLGDFDLDGKITQNDYYELEKYIDQVNSGEEVKIDDVRLIVGDIDQDGEIFDKDLTIFKDYFEKKSDTYKAYYEKIGIEKKCIDGYSLSGNYCVKNEKSNSKDSINNNGYFIVRYDGNGASKSMSDQSIQFGTPTNLLPNNFIKDGYIFAGWRARRDDGTWYCYISPNHSENQVEWKDESFCKQFGYYLYENGQSVSRTANPGHYVTMIAQWSTTTYTIRYSSDGSSNVMEDQKVAYGVDKSLNTNKFTKAGYSFSGWEAELDDGTWYCYTDPSRSISKWTNKSDCESFDYYVFKDKQVIHNLSDSNRTITLHALWKLNASTNNNSSANKKTTIKYDAQDGTGTMLSQTVEPGQIIKLRKLNFARTGYYFDGWKVYNQSEGNKYLCKNIRHHKIVEIIMFIIKMKIR